MSDRKVERLINLTIALLATKRYLTKSEIFDSVAGYEGSPTTMERMFERDKDELRSLGIDIDVGTIDNYFEDELGYRITPTSYGVPVGELSPTELSFISLAAGIWRDQVFGTSAIRAVSKLTGAAETYAFFDPSEVGLALISENRVGELVNQLLDAITDRRVVEFEYDSSPNSHKSIEPHQLAILGGHWYLTGSDLHDGVIKTYKLERFISEVTISAHKGTYDIPASSGDTGLLARENETTEQNFLVALKIKKGSCLQFRSQGQVQSLDHQWDLVEFFASDISALATQVLWQLENVIAIEPEVLVKEFVSRLSKKIAREPRG